MSRHKYNYHHNSTDTHEPKSYRCKDCYRVFSGKEVGSMNSRLAHVEREGHFNLPYIQSMYPYSICLKSNRLHRLVERPMRSTSLQLTDNGVTTDG